MPNEQAKPRRLLSQIDEELVAEGVRGIQSGRWANPHQAAKVLAERQNLPRLWRHSRIGLQSRWCRALQSRVQFQCRNQGRVPTSAISINAPIATRISRAIN